MRRIRKRLTALLLAVMLVGGALQSGGAALSVKAGTVTKNQKLELTGGLKAGTEYGTAEVVKISVLEDFKYKETTVTLEDETTREGYVAGSNNAKTNGSTSKGTVPTTGAAVKFEAVKDCTITIVIRNSSAKKFHLVQQTADDVVTDHTLDETGCDESLYKQVSYDLTAGSSYYLYREGSKASIAEIGYSYIQEENDATDQSSEEGSEESSEPAGEPGETTKLIAFEGAEGGGMYATGGRGGDVYVVTSLEDYAKGDKAIEGTLRYAIDTAPDAGRIIVFHVGGTIHLKQRLSFSGKQNITVAGQTAPGEGITIAGYDTDISNSKNLIFRFVHFRVGTENLLNGGDSMDALWGRDNDTFMIDHCSFSWNTDECLSTYRGKNGTVQWCIVSESLTVSGHSKGRHGYGAIWGGDNTVFQYNLVTNHTSRNPRIGGGSMSDPTNTGSMATLQLSNNIIYNFGYYSCYGGGYTYTNYINNYLKTGPGTRDAVLNQLIAPGENGKVGGFYIAGNYMEGNDAISNDNTLGYDVTGSTTTISDTPYEAEAFESVTLVSAKDAYNQILDKAGVTYPRRDAIDARVVAQVENNTGFYINTQDEVGGYCAPTVSRAADFDTDSDGIPDAWETAHGLNPNDATDSATLNEEGYAWIEVYFNELVKDVVAADYKAMNPDVTIDLANNTLLKEGESITVTATATANNGGSIAKVEFFNGAELVGTATEAPYSFTYTGLADGTYDISVRAYDNEENATQSDTSKLHVNSVAGTGEWTSTDIGTPGVAGTASYENDVLTVKSAGKIGRSEGYDRSVDASYADATTDDFQYVYKKLTGDMEIVTKLDSFLVVDAHTFNGLMFRESLEDDAAAVGLGLSMVKVENSTIWSAFMIDRAQKGGNMTVISETIDSADSAASNNIPLVQDLKFKEGNTFNGTWLKLARNGNTFTGYASDDGVNWKTVGTLNVELPETVYVGFAVDANKAANDIENYATAHFSNIEINTEFVNISYDVTDLGVEGTDKIAFGKDVSVTFTKKTGYLFPDTVQVTSKSGVAVDYTYDAEAGTLLLKNLQEDVTVKATGVKRIVTKVNYEEVDAGNLLTVEEKDGKIILTQTATTGKVASNSTTAYVNESFILFPATKDSETMSMKLKITNLIETNDVKNTGVFVGAFAADNYAFTTLGFRACGADSLAGYWTKNGDRVGNGSPKFVVEKDTEYEITFGMDAKGQYYAKFKNADGTVDTTKTFKVNENFMQKGESTRYGIGLIGATVEITDLKVIDHEGNEIYPGTTLPDTGEVSTEASEETSEPSTEASEEHLHNNSDGTWSYNYKSHWHTCDACDEKLGFADHTWSDWKDLDGKEMQRVCTECGASQNRAIPTGGVPAAGAQTSDHANLWLWMWLALGSMAAVTGVLVQKKKR